MLSATYVAMSCPIPVCYQRHVIVAWAICVCYGHTFISLNFAGIFNIETGISTQLSMMSHDENEPVNAAVFNLLT